MPTRRAIGLHRAEVTGVGLAAVPILMLMGTGAQTVAAGFEKQTDVPIRGRRETQDVYALPLVASAPA